MLSLLLPLALGLLMFGLGLSLTPADFARAARQPREVLIALGCQLVLLPALCFALVLATGLQNAGEAGPYLAAGMMLIAACPGGASASLFSHLFRGDVAFNVTVLAINSVISVFTFPLIANLSFAYFLADDTSIGLQPLDTLQVFVIALVPIAFGMLVRSRAPQFSARLDRPMRVASIVILLVVFVGALIVQSRDILPYLGSIAIIAIVFCIVNLSVGYFVPRLLRVSRARSIAITMELGIHTETLAITVAISVLNEPLLAVPAAAYTVLKFFVIPIFGWAITRKRDDLAVPAAAVAASGQDALPSSDSER
ncbi:bile acid:sodium symporter family protein [Agromyces sp. Q22]|uniref:Bile acid:sodium symporter family protein n=2 Tax=Agromyces kandeliae TaxID=2666141 RepID=A0A6L5R571_9MICO|nr:bile acid:sodium symporter family protein [Agromyces kandeliae]